MSEYVILVFHPSTGWDVFRRTDSKEKAEQFVLDMARQFATPFKSAEHIAESMFRIVEKREQSQ